MLSAVSSLGNGASRAPSFRGSYTMSSLTKPPTPQTIEAYRAAVLAWRTSPAPKSQGSRCPTAVAAVKKLRPAFTDREAEELAGDAIRWAQQIPNECFWDL